MSSTLFVVALVLGADAFVPFRPIRPPRALVARSTPLRATSVPSSDGEDDASALLATAKRLREEADAAEAELRSAVVDGAQRRARELFAQFDSNRDGTLDPSELQAGLQSITGSAPSDAQARALVAKWDANADGVISPEEWDVISADPIGALRAALRELAREESDAARAESDAARAASAAAAAEAAEAAYAARWEQPAGAGERAAALIPLLLPLADVLPLLGPVSSKLPEPAAAALAPLIQASVAFDTLPFGTLGAFLAISAVANNPTLSVFRRFHAHLAINVDIALFVPTTLVRLALFANWLTPESADPLIGATAIVFAAALAYIAGGAASTGLYESAGLLGPLASRAKSSTDRLRLVEMEATKDEKDEGTDKR